MESIFHRTSVRKYLEKDVEQEKVEKMLRAAFAAPSAQNQQPWEFYVVTDKTILERLSQCSPYSGCIKDAPLGFIACCRKDVKLPEYAQIDLSASVENLLLEADHLGLGAVWLGIAPVKERMEKVREAADIKNDVEPFAVISCGYPQEIKEQQDRYDASRVHFVG